jgi:transcription elongation factor Elf1
MNNPHITRRKPERVATCRLCEKDIAVGSPAVVFEGIHVSPKVVDLFFHVNCIETAMDDAEEKGLVGDP